MDAKPNLAIAWFSENDWGEWKKISEDYIEDEYDEWHVEASLAVSKFEEDGYNVVKINIKPNEFKKWCRKNNKKLDSASRSQYAGIVANMGRN